VGTACTSPLVLYIRFRFDERVGFFRALVVGLDGTLFSASDDGTLMVWRVDNGALVHAHTVECASAVNTLAIGQGDTLHSGAYNGNVLIW
jgi:WD40 repeat protein